MPRIPNTPSVRTFTETWSSDFKEAVKKAAGKDGRLTMNEAKKLGERPDADKVFADNAVNYLKATGKQSVSVEVLATSAKAYAQRQAELAAGADGRLSLADGAKLAPDLRDDFFMLRGKTVPGSTPASSLADLRAKLDNVTPGVWMPSETDAKFKFIGGGPLNGAPITAEVVRAQLATQHDAMLPDVMWTDPSSIPLANKNPVEERDAAAWLSRLTTNFDPADDISRENAGKIGEIKRVLESELTDLKVFRFGTIEISTFIVGRTKTGELAGVLTGQVET
jgi:hypothetical protein